MTEINRTPGKSKPNPFPQSKGHQAFQFCLRLFWVGALAAALIVAIWVYIAGIESMQQGLTVARPYLALWRLFMFGILIGGWHYWIEWLARWAGLDAHRKQAVLGLRWRTAAWLLVIEAILVQGVVSAFIHNIMMSGSPEFID